MKILITGAGGFLGTALRRAWADRHDLTGWGRALNLTSLIAVDVTDAEAVRLRMREAPPDAVVHCAAMARTGECAADPEASRRVNVQGAANVARAAKEAGARMVLVSTDLVFDGSSAPYAEDAPLRPLSVYGLHKLEAERAALESGGAVCRLPLLLGADFSPRANNALRGLLTAMREGGRLTLFEDEWRTPLFVDDAAAGIELAVRQGVRILHLSGGRRLNRLELGRLTEAVYERESGLKSRAELAPSRQADLPGEPRPPDVSLDIDLARSLGFEPVDFEDRLTSAVRAALGKNG